MNDEEIIKYLDNQLSEEEKKAFEAELLKSESLRKQLDQYKSVLSETKKLNQIQTDEKYFLSLVPQIREKLEVKKLSHPFRKVSYVFSVVIVLFTIGYLAFFSKINEPKVFDFSLNGLSAEISDEDKIDIFNYLNDENNISSYYEIAAEDYESKLLNNVDESDRFVLAEKYELNVFELAGDLPDNEIELFYYEILNKNFN